MKLNRGLIGWLIAGFVWCIFMGIFFVSIGLGAIYPPLNYIGRPFICPNGQMTYTQASSNPLPGTTYTQLQWYCTDQRTGQTSTLDFLQVGVAAGPIYGVAMGVILSAVVLLLYTRLQSAPQPSAHSRPQRANRSNSGRASAPAPAKLSSAHAARLKELNDLRSQNLISAEEYHQKRDEIMKDL